MLSKSALIFFLALVASVQTASAEPDEVVKLNNQAVRLISSGDLNGALEKLQQALRISPDYKIAKENLAIPCLLSDGEPQKQNDEVL